MLILVLAGCVTPMEDVDLRVPRMDPTTIDGTLGASEWDEAASFGGVFRIAESSAGDGEFPFRAWVGVDASWLYFATRVENVSSRNPFDEPNSPNATRYPEGIGVYFDPATEGPLHPPADKKYFWNFREIGHGTIVSYWTGTEWRVQDENVGRMERGTFSRGGYDSDSLWWEARIPRTSLDPAHDGVDFDSGTTFRMALRFDRQCGLCEFSGGSVGDTFPSNTRDGHLLPETWLRVRIDG